MVNDFLTWFVWEDNIQEMSEAEALVALPSFHKWFSKSRSESTAEMVFRKEGNISSWRDTVQYLLRNYAQSPRNILAIVNFRARSQGLMGTERELATRLNRVICRYGNLQSPEMVLTLFNPHYSSHDSISCTWIQRIAPQSDTPGRYGPCQPQRRRSTGTYVNTAKNRIEQPL